MEEVQIQCPVANSDHSVITFAVPIGEYEQKRKQKVYNYHRADYGGICSRLMKIDWEKKMEGVEVEQL